MNDADKLVNLGGANNQRRAHHDAIADATHHQTVADANIADERPCCALRTAKARACCLVRNNLDRAERLGFVASADEWFAMRGLRNQMVHEYIEGAMVLKSALQAGHRFVPVLLQAANRLTTQINKLSPA